MANYLMYRESPITRCHGRHKDRLVRVWWMYGQTEFKCRVCKMVRMEQW